MTVIEDILDHEDPLQSLHDGRFVHFENPGKHEAEAENTEDESKPNRFLLLGTGFARVLELAPGVTRLALSTQRALVPLIALGLRVLAT